jgi:hypothetical protein
MIIVIYPRITGGYTGTSIAYLKKISFNNTQNLKLKITILCELSNNLHNTPLAGLIEV